MGELQREFTLTSTNEWNLDTPGGSALYASAGYLVWESAASPGILTRVGEDFPQAWLDDFVDQGIDVRGVKVLPDSLDLRSCVLLEGKKALLPENPLPYLSQRNTLLPPALIGYSGRTGSVSSRRERKPTSIREGDIPGEYSTASSAHICPMDYLSHNLLPAVFRGKGFSTLTLDPGSSYMIPEYFNDIPALIPGLTAFLPSEKNIMNLYKGKSIDLWEIAGDLGCFGCELVIIKRGRRGLFLYESATGRKWDVPAYPARVVSPVGAGDSFCGGFLAGYGLTFDPLEAALYGSVSASLAIEGRGAFFGLDALPGLAEARLEALREQVRKV